MTLASAGRSAPARPRRVTAMHRGAFTRDQDRAMARRRILAGIALVMLLVLSMVGTALFDAYVMTAQTVQGDALRQVLVLAIVGLLLIGGAEARHARSPMAMPLSILLLLGYCLLSVAWAVDPLISLRRLLLTAMVIWILVRAVGDLGAVRVLALLRWTLAILLLASFLAVAFTDFGIHTASIDESESVIGNWRGVMPHKNITGAACAMTVLVFLFERGRTPGWLAGVIIAAALAFLIGTNSKTSMGMLAIAIPAGVLMRFYNPRHRSLVWPVGLIGAAIAGGLLLAFSGAIENLLNDPTMLTGRTAIWPFLLEYAAEHPWTGAGFGSFWQIGSASPIHQFTSGWVSQYASHGHNGFLDLLVTIGLPGLLLAVAALLVWPALRLLSSVSIAPRRRAFLAAVLIFAAGHNLTESTLLDRLATVNVFLLLAVVLIHRLSNQSLGRHHAVRMRMMHLARQVPARLGRTRQSAGRPRPHRPAQEQPDGPRDAQ